MIKVSLLDKISILLVLVGALNWGLIGAFNINLVQIISGNIAIIMRIVYIAVGLSAINTIYFLFKCVIKDTI